MRGSSPRAFSVGSIRLLPAVALAAWVGVSAPARADERPARVRLEWTSDGDCVDAATLRAEVEESLGRPAFSDDGELVLGGHAGRVEAGFEARVTLSRSTGELLGTRTFTSPATRCDELSRGLPLALALMIDLPLREATVRVVVPVPVPVPAAPLYGANHTAVPPSGPSPAAPSRRQASLVAGPIVRFGWIPSVAAGARVALELGLGPVQVGADGTWVAPSLQDDGDVAARTFGLSAAVYACPWHPSSARLYAGACAYTEAGAVIADGVRAASPRHDVAWLLSLGGRFRAGLRWSPWTVGLELGGGGFLVRPRLAYDIPGGGSATLAQAWPGSIDVFAFVGTWFP